MTAQATNSAQFSFFFFLFSLLKKSRGDDSAGHELSAARGPAGHSGRGASVS